MPEMRVYYHGMIRRMTADKLAISLPEELAQHVRKQAADEGESVSAWIAEAIEHKLRNRGLAVLVAEWEAESGPITDEERERAKAFWRGSPSTPAR
jgi:hypothetical protein